MTRLVFSLFLMATLAPLSGCQCSSSSQTAPANSADAEREKILAKGKSVYLANCIACHNANPKLPGSLGPEVAGASTELLTARLVKGNYPEGYTPKRSSHIMQAMPHLQGDIDALSAFLNSK